MQKLNLQQYCTPAKVYLAISFISVLMIVIQNLLNPTMNELCVGKYKCAMSSKITLLIFKIIYILFWAWLLNVLCKNGLTKLAWFILMIPFLLVAAIFTGLIFMNPVNPPNANGNRPNANGNYELNKSL
jgi:hypothetical protein